MSQKLPTSQRAPFLLVIALATMYSSAYGQGLVSGVVVDGPSRTPIEGVTVVLAGTLFGTVTGSDGTFTLGPVPDGEYKLRVIRAGYEPFEIAAVVPGGRLVLQLGKERSDLSVAPLAVYSEAFRKGEFFARGDPILGAISTSPTRVPGVTVRRYGLAFLDPMIRGFAEGRSRFTHGDFLSSTHEIPGVGRIDLHSRDGDGGEVYYGGVPLSGLPIQSSLWWPTIERDVPAIGRAVVEAGYQTNLDAFHTSGDYLGRIDDTRYRLIASHSQSSDYKGASGQSVDASFKRSSGRITVNHEFARGGSVRFAGEASEARSVSIPGAEGVLDYGRLLGASAAFQITPERKLLRRLSGNLSYSHSNVTIDDLDARGVLGDAMKRSVGAVLAADLFHPRLETAQAGVRVGHVTHEGQIQPPGSSSQSYFWPDVGVLSGEAFAMASIRTLSTRAAVSGRAGFARFNPNAALAGGSSALSQSTDVVGSLAASVAHRRDQNLSLSFGLSVIRRAPSVLQRYPARHLPVDGPRTVLVAGDSALDPEWVYTFDSAFSAR
ncbi:MAG: carboxypeptidase-like regulatory domain-containing protein, partial [Rhodothermia bacterium]|nr:carboxypeptidase-like regulatory domain-containing protein [Rhodothermia bacterium]